MDKNDLIYKTECLKRELATYKRGEQIFYKTIDDLKNKLHRRNLQIKELKNRLNKSCPDIGSPIYARDMNPDILNDSFFGKNFESMVKSAESQGLEVIVGKAVKKPYINE